MTPNIVLLFHAHLPIACFCFQCLDDEFGCRNGTCISLSKRCDGVPDCQDEFDEHRQKVYPYAVLFKALVLLNGYRNTIE